MIDIEAMKCFITILENQSEKGYSVWDMQIIDPAYLERAWHQFNQIAEFLGAKVKEND